MIKIIGQITSDGVTQTLEMMKVAVREHKFIVENTEDFFVELYQKGYYEEEREEIEIYGIGENSDDLEKFATFAGKLSDYFADYEEEKHEGAGYPEMKEALYELLKDHITFKFFDGTAPDEDDIEDNFFDYFIIEITHDELENIDKTIDKWREFKEMTELSFKEVKKAVALLND